MKKSRMLNRLRFILGKGQTPANLLDRVCQCHPDNPLFFLEAPISWTGMMETAISPGMLLPFVNRLGNCLLASGMRRHDRIAIWKTNSPDYFFIALAIVKAGGIAVPINAGMPTATLLHYLKTMGVKRVITDAEGLSKCLPQLADFEFIEEWLLTSSTQVLGARQRDLRASLPEMSDKLAPVSMARDYPAFIVHTSGTTGFPKGVISSAGGIIAGIKGHFLSEPIHRFNRIAVAVHYNHIVTMLGLFTSLAGNLRTYCLQPKGPEAQLQEIAQHRINIFFGFPDVFLNLLDHGLDGHDLSSVKVWISTADASHEAHMQEFVKHGAALRLLGKRLLGSVFMEPLGTSEVGFAAVQRIFFPFTTPKYRRMIGYRNLAGPRAKVADADGRNLKPGQLGRLMVKGPTLFHGYWNAHDRSLGEFCNGWWYTGDEVYRDRWGRFFHFDRHVDIIHTTNGPVYCTLAEERILAHPEILEVAIFGVPDVANAQVPIAVIARKKNATQDAESLRGWINATLQLATPVAKAILVTHAEIPRGLTGKVLRRQLRDLYAHVLQS